MRIHFVRFIYPLKFLDPCTLFILLLLVLLLTIVYFSCQNRSAQHDIVGGDDLNCHFGSILQTTGLQYRDFIHISFHNRVRK